MILPNRPILLITLPSLALLLGFVWLRRKKSFCDTGGDKKDKTESSTKSNKTIAEQTSCASLLNYSNHSQSRPITQNGSNQGNNLKNSTQKGQKSGSNSGSSSANSSFENKLGKSAPIDIAPNPRSPPKRITEQQVDHEILKLKIQEADYKDLLSIQESEDFEPESTPADSPFYRNKFDLNLRSEPKVEPVIIKATMAAKVSPENSFAESKYTSVESGDDDETRDSANPSPVGGDDKEQSNNICNEEAVKQPNQATETEAGAVDTTTEITIDENQSPTRNPIASPPLSLCSVHSGDSGKGSSPPNSIGAPSLSYEFLIPQTLIGILIGRKGTFVNSIKTKTGANVTVKKNPHSRKSKICTIEGTQAEIDAALKMIRTKLPEKKFPHLTLDRIVSRPENSLVPTFDPSVLHVS